MVFPTPDTVLETIPEGRLPYVKAFEAITDKEILANSCVKGGSSHYPDLNLGEAVAKYRGDKVYGAFRLIYDAHHAGTLTPPLSLPLEELFDEMQAAITECENRNSVEFNSSHFWGLGGWAFSSTVLALRAAVDHGSRPTPTEFDTDAHRREHSSEGFRTFMWKLNRQERKQKPKGVPRG